jgi:hypothetical protein
MKRFVDWMRSDWVTHPLSRLEWVILALVVVLILLRIYLSITAG